ncbi:rubredoxin-like domain-containing protein [Candidatus Stoquefichus massiliensis]|uniref:rubredoxin-like domain-containing protein n=1 Tax=Candidatus Stoquefichus massiliensis TaxID=1470350 RepID=UPI00048757F5|nr:rubredoxin [Candidatus Stoquefichus massiliensis]
MAKYVCQVCGFVYDEDQVNPLVLWDELSSDWVCPLCKAPKSAFKKEKSQQKDVLKREEVNKNWTTKEISIILSNLAKGCEKQYLEHEQDLFLKLSEYYQNLEEDLPTQALSDIQSDVDKDLSHHYPLAHEMADQMKDRGAKRAIVWSEKSTNMIASLIERYQQEKENLTKDTKVFVCEICGFIYIGAHVPEICPVCKVPSLKIHEVKRGYVL